MVVNCERENKTPFGRLPPAATAHGNDAISSRIAIIHKNLQKKQQPPRFVGGIWDIDDSMDTAESPDVANRESVHLQLKSMLQCENPYFEIDDKMDTIEACNSEDLSFLSPSFLEVNGGDMDITAAKIPEVPKKEPETMKKKNMDEVSLERSKRCRTSSKTDVYPLQSSFDGESDFPRAVMSKDSPPVEGASAEPIASEIKNYSLPQTLDLNSPALSKEPQIDINGDTLQTDGIELKTEEQNFYQKEINDLQKVVLILKSHNTDKKEHSDEVAQLQKICLVLKSLGNSSHQLSNGTLDVNESVPSRDLAGEAAFTLNGIPHKEYQSTELTNSIEDNLKPVINEDVSSIIQTPCGSASHSVNSNKESETGIENQSPWLQQIVNGTLPWKPIGRPPPAAAFSFGSVQSTSSPTAIKNSSKMQQSSKNGALLQETEMLQLKANPEQSFGRAMEADDIFEILKNAASRGSPPPMAAFGKSPTTSPSRTVSKSSSMAHDTLFPMQSGGTILPPAISNKKEDLVGLFDEASMNFPNQNAAVEKSSGGLPMCAAAVEAAKVPTEKRNKGKGHQDEPIEVPKVKPLKMDVNLPKLASVSTSRSVLELNSVNSVPSFKAKMTQSPYHLRSSMETPKEPKSPDPLKDNVTMMKEAVPSSTKYIPPHLRSKSSSSFGNEASRSRQGFRPETNTSQNYSRSASKTRDASFPYQVSERKATEIKNSAKSVVTMKTDLSNQQAQGFKTEAFSNWRKADSPPKLNDRSSSFQEGAVEDSYTKLSPNDGKTLNLNLKTDSSSSRSNPSDSDSSKRNRPAKTNDRRQPSNDRKILNYELKKTSAYGVQHSENAMISLKVFDEQNAVVYERTLPLSNLVQITKNCPSLSDIIPSTGEKDRELLISGSAVKAFLECVFPASSVTTPGWEVALEAYYLAKKYGIEKLQDHCKNYFNVRPIRPCQVEGIKQIARRLQITDVLKNSYTMFAEVHSDNIPDASQPITIKERKCVVSCTPYVDPSEYLVPLYYVKETGLAGTKDYDIRNEIIFEAKSGTFCLTGLQIKLEAETKDFRKKVTLYCDVYKSTEKVFELEKEKTLNNLMVIDFKQRLLVEPGEIATISVLMDGACMRMCHCLTKENEYGRCEGGRFEVSFSSDKKSEARQQLFFIEKLLYTFEGRKN